MKIKFLSILFFTMMINGSGYVQIEIRFIGVMNGQYITPNGMHIAGQFAIHNAITISDDWEPGAAGSQLSLISGST